jgi:hypothetical protein
MIVSDLLEQTCNKSDDAIKLVTSCYNNWEQAVRTQLVDSLHVNRFVTTCLQTRNNLCVFTCVVSDDKENSNLENSK